MSSDPEREVERGLRLEEGRLVLGPEVEVDAEVRREDEGLEQHEDPHVRFTRDAFDVLRRRVRRRRGFGDGHEGMTLASGWIRRGASGASDGTGPSPRSSRWIRSRSR